jgi:hypothetical protein
MQRDIWYTICTCMWPALLYKNEKTSKLRFGLQFFCGNCFSMSEWCISTEFCGFRSENPVNRGRRCTSHYGVLTTRKNHSTTCIRRSRCWNERVCTGLLLFHIFLRRKNRLRLLKMTKKTIETRTFQPQCKVGGSLLNVDHSRTMSSIADVENEDVSCSCTPYSDLKVHRFSVCDRYILSFVKGFDSGHIQGPRGTHNRLQCPCNIVKR